MTSGLVYNPNTDVFPGLFFRARHLGRLPSDRLPFAAAFEKCPRVQVIVSLSRPLPFRCPDQAKGDDRGIAVLLNANIFSAKDSGGTSLLRLRCRALVAHNVGLAHAPPG